MKASPKKIVFPAIFLVMFVLLLVIILGDNGLVELNRLQGIHDGLVETNIGLTKENRHLYRTIDRLKNDPAFVEAVARRELGMVHSGEMIFKFNTPNRSQ